MRSRDARCGPPGGRPASFYRGRGFLGARALLLGAIVWALAGSAARGAPPQDHSEVRYEIRLAAELERFPIRASFPARDRARLVVEIPRWRPGSYRFQPYRERVRIEGAFAPDGKELPWLRLHEGAWEVETRGAERVELRYLLDARSDERGGLLEGPGTWLYAAPGKGWPCRVRFDVEEPWSVASGLDPTEEQGVVVAPDYDTFADCPVLYGELERHMFETHGAPHHVIFRGATAAAFDRQAVLDGVQIAHRANPADP